MNTEIGFVPYAPLGRGLLSGRFKSPDDLARIAAELPAAAGERYDEAGMAAFDL
jgi:aryl-alcohol dehydrogenase-like predicted oxidoreductase